MMFNHRLLFPASRTALLLASLLTLNACAPTAATSASTQPKTPEALARQGLEAGKNYPGLSDICDLNKTLIFAGRHNKNKEKRTLTAAERQRRSAASVAEPTQVFDNLYFVGNKRVASWAIKTSEGLILIDAMNSNNQAEHIIVAGLKKLGLDPNDIKYLIITHAHGDHYGGQEYLVKHFHPRVVMSDRDWQMLEKSEGLIANPRWGKAPVRDIAVNDGDILTLGDTRIGLYVTPGHTMGTLSLIIPLKEGQDTHMAALWGGTGLNFGPDETRLRMYSDSARRFQSVAAKQSVDVFLSNHPRRDNALERIARLKARQPGAPHPFTDPDALQAFELLQDCSLAQAEQVHQRQAARKNSSE
ncbi:Metallo-beta-lactamase L1 precursor [Vibrio aerogenes CECT 7868]|uniref:Metallo-beta-lactamase L1 n=1 Tax=Vibrio aerogenes CECT 7868 TaxID=1216006 RepID=A0A1M5X255_9VIBR|nr:MBL fold metallo-hydrolase [Vibrio aerogenes]SHH93955.1 Metallo-beta-lactamase L1 precursor [Vibrio aerogenes CECT 7868]